MTVQSLANLENAKDINARNELLIYLINQQRITTLDAIEILGIMSPSQRIGELLKLGAPIIKDWTIQTDLTGKSHRVRVYIWSGESSQQGDLFGGQFASFKLDSIMSSGVVRDGNA